MSKKQRSVTLCGTFDVQTSPSVYGGYVVLKEPEIVVEIDPRVRTDKNELPPPMDLHSLKIGPGQGGTIYSFEYTLRDAKLPEGIICELQVTFYFGESK